MLRAMLMCTVVACAGISPAMAQEPDEQNRPPMRERAERGKADDRGERARKPERPEPRDGAREHRREGAPHFRREMRRGAGEGGLKRDGKQRGPGLDRGRPDGRQPGADRPRGPRMEGFGGRGEPGSERLLPPRPEPRFDDDRGPRGFDRRGSSGEDREFRAAPHRRGPVGGPRGLDRRMPPGDGPRFDDRGPRGEHAPLRRGGAEGRDFGPRRGHGMMRRDRGSEADKPGVDRPRGPRPGRDDGDFAPMRERSE